MTRWTVPQFEKGGKRLLRKLEFFEDDHQHEECEQETQEVPPLEVEDIIVERQTDSINPCNIESSATSFNSKTVQLPPVTPFRLIPPPPSQHFVTLKIPNTINTNTIPSYVFDQMMALQNTRYCYALQNAEDDETDEYSACDLEFWFCSTCKKTVVEACRDILPISNYPDDNYNAKRHILNMGRVFEKMLQCYGNTLDEWLGALIKTQQGNKRVRILLPTETVPPSKVFTRHVNDILYMKDNNLLSFKTLGNIKKEANLFTEFGSMEKLKGAKKELDNNIRTRFKIHNPSASFKGHILDLNEAIKAILDLYYALGGKYKKKVYFKISVDGRTIANSKQVAVALVPLNLRSVFKSQAVSSVFYIGLFQMSETTESIEKTIGTISKEITAVQLNQYGKDDSYPTSVKLLYVSDMHNVGFTFDYDLCPYCIAKKVENFDAEIRNGISGRFSFQPDEIILCSLHVKQRLVENTIGYMASSCEHKDKILENLKKLKGLEGFSWRELKDRVSENGTPSTQDRVVTKSSMLSGEQCDTILKNVNLVVSGIVQESAAEYRLILNMLKNIIIIIEMKQGDDGDTSTHRSKDKKIITENRIQELEKWILKFLVHCYDVWGPGIKAHYFHFLIHIPSIIRRLLGQDLSLAITSNQGFERSHLFHHSVFNRIMNNGGGRGVVTSITEQLLLWQWRKVLLALNLQEKHFGERNG